MRIVLKIIILTIALGPWMLHAETLELEIKGMVCKSCSESITSRLSQIKGVEILEIDHEKGSAVIDAKESSPEINSIIAAINELGYEAKLRKTSSESPLGPRSSSSAKGLNKQRIS